MFIWNTEGKKSDLLRKLAKNAEKLVFTCLDAKKAGWTSEVELSYK